ncbi:hypothetical protein F5B17DRAFT_38029 [Nemania serpens]|nr:hypothetical protein F5B17DRAFT_38029 [Nemania serpens]
MLLTSSQVSVLLTSGMVLLCTSALFISGCLIQQRTLRDLRSAIRPAVVTRPRPKVWANAEVNGDVNPDAGFRRTRKRRATTTTTRIRLEDGSVVEIRSPEAEDGSPSESQFEERQGEEEAEGEGEVIEVRLTPEESSATTTTQEQEQSEKAQTNNGDGNHDDDGNGNGNSGDGLKVVPSWDGVQEGGEPLSRAERRRRIKAEIQRLSRGDAPVYYQRRLW